MTDGFLGTGAPATADVNLLVQLGMGVALLRGWRLARARRFRAHQLCQTSVVVLNLLMITLIMAPSFRKQVPLNPMVALSEAQTKVAYLHAALGTLAELLGIYVVLVAGTKLVPPRFRFAD